MNTEQELKDAGYELTPEIFHSGLGDGKIYIKSVANVEPFTDNNVEGSLHYDSYSVNPNGVVAPFVPMINVKPTEVIDVVPPDVLGKETSVEEAEVKE